MKPLPHEYEVTLSASTDGEVVVSAPGLSSMATAPPAEFGGPGNRWSPETLLVAAVADCLVLTFRAMARASRLPWLSMTCHATGLLERSEGKSRFTSFTVKVDLEVPQGVNESQAVRLLEKSEANCLISNSLTAEVKLELSVKFGQATLQS